MGIFGPNFFFGGDFFPRQAKIREGNCLLPPATTPLDEMQIGYRSKHRKLVITRLLSVKYFSL